ncbi:uncharacterized protein MYCGRDRAFT_44529 [Zymoseptoria tritici IPO323]|uniref:NmrA-like domain-containing protein n=1 Tax=Zymoseptoria tritici (strain CBS 115943 / IPO323) TaxID=336722 RepID=F9XGJ7_ZYMTI|nr:uncharacterized protein MYCGRDRAFT_44529 [Zymoseptoria tritici IPO323]EGP86022.1 hypothetical protein MYCGRDRAFT_44529 [Zymoseptoria tritici IPO323]
MSQKLIVITGVTGSQGSSVAKHLLKHRDWHVKGITRNLNPPKARHLTEHGVELVRGDFDDVDSLGRAFMGATAIFAVTDYAAVLSRTTGSEALRKKAAKAGQNLSEYARDWELRQGLNIAKAASDPQVLSTLTHFIFSTLPGIKKWSGGKYTTAYQFDSKAAIEDHIRIDLPDLSKRLSTFAMGMYPENSRDQPYCAPHKETDGSGYYFVMLENTGEQVKFPELWCSQDAGTFVDALVRRFPPGIDVMGASEFVSKEELAARWGRSLGVKAVARPIPEKDWKAMVARRTRG